MGDIWVFEVMVLIVLMILEGEIRFFLRFVYCNVLLDLRQNVKWVEYDTTPYMYWYFNISTDFKKFSLSKSSIKYKLIVHLLYFLKSQASIQVGSLAFIITIL